MERRKIFMATSIISGIISIPSGALSVIFGFMCLTPFTVQQGQGAAIGFGLMSIACAIGSIFLRKQVKGWICPTCGAECTEGKFCTCCGTQKPDKTRFVRIATKLAIYGLILGTVGGILMGTIIGSSNAAQAASLSNLNFGF